MRKAYGMLKTEDEMKYDYSIAGEDYVFSPELYKYFIALNQQSIQRPVITEKVYDRYGQSNPTADTIELGRILRDLFTA